MELLLNCSPTITFSLYIQWFCPTDERKPSKVDVRQNNDPPSSFYLQLPITEIEEI